jgi:hypothetical protein
MFRGGLRHYTRHQERMITGQKSVPSDYHDKIDYERVFFILFRVVLFTQDQQLLNT